MEYTGEDLLNSKELRDKISCYKFLGNYISLYDGKTTDYAAANYFGVDKKVIHDIAIRYHDEFKGLIEICNRDEIIEIIKNDEDEVCRLKDVIPNQVILLTYLGMQKLSMLIKYSKKAKSIRKKILKYLDKHYVSDDNGIYTYLKTDVRYLDRQQKEIINENDIKEVLFEDGYLLCKNLENNTVSLGKVYTDSKYYPRKNQIFKVKRVEKIVNKDIVFTGLSVYIYV